MNDWFLHFILYSIGFAATVLIAAGVGRLLRRDPRACYRVLVLALLASLMLPMAQWAAHGWIGSRFSSMPVILPWFESLRKVQASTTYVPLPESSSPLSVAQGLPSPLQEDDSQPAPVETPFTARNVQWVLAVIYCFGFLIMARRGFAGIMETARVLSRSRPATNPELLTAWKHSAGASRLAARVDLRISPELTTPACWGVLHPCIIVPERGLFLDREDILHCALIHELVHLERYDTCVTLLQKLAAALVWFHPGMWWLDRRLAELREISCDQEVVSRTGHRRRYASALVDYVALLSTEPGSRTGLIRWTGSSQDLKKRIEMLIACRKNTLRRMRSLVLAAGVAAISGIWGMQLLVAASITPGSNAEGGMSASGETISSEQLDIEDGVVDAASAASVKNKGLSNQRKQLSDRNGSRVPGIEDYAGILMKARRYYADTDVETAVADYKRAIDKLSELKEQGMADARTLKVLRYLETLDDEGLRDCFAQAKEYLENWYGEDAGTYRIANDHLLEGSDLNRYIASYAGFLDGRYDLVDSYRRSLAQKGKLDDIRDAYAALQDHTDQELVERTKRRLHEHSIHHVSDESLRKAIHQGRDFLEKLIEDTESDMSW